MPPCVVRPVGPPARAGEHSKPSCPQARAVRARRTDVLGVGGVPIPKRPKSCLRARACPSYPCRGGCHPPALSSCSWVAPVGPAAGCRGPPTIHASIHLSIQACLYCARGRHPTFHANHSSIHARRPVALGMRPSLSCTSTCRARFGGALLVIPALPRPINRARCDASNGVPCPTQVAGVGHARGAAAQWWWAHGGPAGVIGGKNCTNGKWPRPELRQRRAAPCRPSFTLGVWGRTPTSDQSFVCFMPLASFVSFTSFLSLAPTSCTRRGGTMPHAPGWLGRGMRGGGRSAVVLLRRAGAIGGKNGTNGK